ncbi:fimbria/pilus periplasmic chaperone [Serratia marcescens]|uniref:fimbria/pilus periplasmic chaperone n=1 Tax=Serratia marcescens TaxID=615 RepID=UPI0020CA77B6|nr:fimbria/pilus periplasmic chaperone [Serratia marcescens]
MNKAITLTMLGAISCLFSASVFADMETTSESFSVKLGATRVIYDPASNGATITVANPQDYPILLQSVVLSEDKKSKAPFIVTPPLMRLEALQQSRLRIIRTGGHFATDRETMQWFCAKGIPPKADDAWTQGQKPPPVQAKDNVSVKVQLSISNCIKLQVRPSSVKGGPEFAAQNITWTQKGNKLEARNNSPFYMNLISLSVGSVKINDISYIPPFGTHLYPLPKGKSGNDVSWQIVNDFGGESQLYKGKVIALFP